MWFTVIGLHGDDRFADHVEADAWEQAEEIVKNRRGETDVILVAGVLTGKHFCVDGCQTKKSLKSLRFDAATVAREYGCLLGGFTFRKEGGIFLNFGSKHPINAVTYEDMLKMLRAMGWKGDFMERGDGTFGICIEE